MVPPHGGFTGLYWWVNSMSSYDPVISSDPAAELATLALGLTNSWSLDCLAVIACKFKLRCACCITMLTTPKVFGLVLVGVCNGHQPSLVGLSNNSLTIISRYSQWTAILYIIVQLIKHWQSPLCIVNSWDDCFRWYRQTTTNPNQIKYLGLSTTWTILDYNHHRFKTQNRGSFQGFVTVPWGAINKGFSQIFHCSTGTLQLLVTWTSVQPQVLLFKQVIDIKQLSNSWK